MTSCLSISTLWLNSALGEKQLRDHTRTGSPPGSVTSAERLGGTP
jgi:hypothetical protein